MFRFNRGFEHLLTPPVKPPPPFSTGALLNSPPPFQQGVETPFFNPPLFNPFPFSTGLKLPSTHSPVSTRGLETRGGHELSELIEEVVCEVEDELDKVLSGLGQKEQVEHVSEESCESLRRKLTCCFGLEESDLSPRPGGLVPGIFKVLTVEANDPDVHIHQWLTGHPGADRARWGFPHCLSLICWQGGGQSALSACHSLGQHEL